jgi:hypothetical protein
VSQNKRGGISSKTPFQKLEAAVEKAAQMIARHAGISGISVERELRSALRNFKYKRGV